MNASQQPLAVVLADLAAVGRKLVESSEKALALIEANEAECLSSPREPASRADAPMPTTSMLLTRDEVVGLLRLSDRSFCRLRSDRANRFPAPVRGRPLRWRAQDVERWLTGARR